MTAETTGAHRENAVQEFIMHHVMDNEEAWHIGSFSLPLPPGFTLHLLMAVLGVIFLLFVFGYLYRKNDKTPTGLTNALEILVLFVRNEICFAYLGREDGKRLCPLFLTFFFMILVLNFMGLVPIFSTATSNLNLTAALASVAFYWMTVGAILKNGFGGFMSAFIPKGVPTVMLVLIVPLELFGVLIKSSVLAIRLFANMFGGHISLFTILGLILIYGKIATPALILGLFVFFLEILVSFLQAYIFTLLTAIFMGQIYHPEH